MGKWTSDASGRVGLTTKLPPQLGHRLLRRSVTHSAQNVHSKVQMRASSAPFGRSRSHISQFGRISNIGHLGMSVSMGPRPVRLARQDDDLLTAGCPPDPGDREQCRSLLSLASGSPNQGCGSSYHEGNNDAESHAEEHRAWIVTEHCCSSTARPVPPSR